MKITIVSFDIPYPPVHGGRVDMWERIKAFSELGIDLQLICWINNFPSPEEVAEINKYVQQTYLIPYNRKPIFLARRIFDLLFYPLEVTSRVVRGKELCSLLESVRAFNPCVIFSDGIYGGETAYTISRELGVPLVTRSHNIEYIYHRKLLESSKGKEKLVQFLSLMHLEDYEKSLLRNSVRFYDISIDDLKFWESQGFDNGRYLPPSISISKSDANANTDDFIYQYDVVFLGNLNLPNNVEGINWFLAEVLPLIYAKLPSTQVLIAGSNPVNEIQQKCRQTKGVTLSINPASSKQVYRSGRVLINPVLSGSGVSIKSIEMLASERPIVSTPQGTAGLPDEVKKYFSIANTPQNFALEIVNYLSSNNPQFLFPKELLESYFGLRKIQNILLDLESISRKPIEDESCP